VGDVIESFTTEKLADELGLNSIVARKQEKVEKAEKEAAAAASAAEAEASTAASV
jgi:translation initiation factor IF-2